MNNISIDTNEMARDVRCASWLGLEIHGEEPTKPYDLLEITPQNVTVLKDAPQAKTVVVDFTPKGFGPAAALIADAELAWKRGERLKIFQGVG